jgi:hypothetical protein
LPLLSALDQTSLRFQLELWLSPSQVWLERTISWALFVIVDIPEHRSRHAAILQKKKLL